MNELQEQLIELQTRVAFQEDTLTQLNQVVAKQDQEILTLQQQLRLLAKRFDDTLYQQEQGDGKPLDERPPHY
ncbi:MAG TPA: SlyX family protein [Cellvibrio sp.]|jgi:SlyX protein|nr:SlyX family protein [Cellvibrio sp.]